MNVTVYTFEGADGVEQGYHTYESTDAEETARKNGWRVIANEYEWQDSSPVEGWDFTRTCTAYGNLPLVPGDRWDIKILPVDQHTVLTEVTALDAESAEMRSLAVIDKDYEDDLRGATATAEPLANGDFRWRVTVTLRPVE